ncbi:hypothetical protein [Magnetospirillum moscoviense]|uniref:Uncharacterized protein n=1 Tax=Magnetospirillum moscoviense TaxID=1437059 RepID=A0A178MDD9_9PROT|nr:hypothetical protein [Magnetospirillum moscoviense]OAN46157.1 hypothetical protein A6A05_16325 [Magnetospirillum moscoviense]
MKTLMHGFWVALFVAVVVCGFYGQGIYWFWRTRPEEAFPALAFLFAMTWWFAIAVSLIGQAGFDLGGLVDRLRFKFGRKPGFDAAGAVARDREIHQAGLQSLKELRREQSGKVSGEPTVGGFQ